MSRIVREWLNSVTSEQDSSWGKGTRYLTILISVCRPIWNSFQGKEGSTKVNEERADSNNNAWVLLHWKPRYSSVSPLYQGWRWKRRELLARFKSKHVQEHWWGKKLLYCQHMSAYSATIPYFCPKLFIGDQEPYSGSTRYGWRWNSG